ncbi:MAG: spore coat protein CotJB [Oscillospiraceae bacterium]
MEFRTQPMIEAALREARQEAAQEAPQPERTEQQDAACGMLPACAPLANPFVPFQRDDPPVYAAAVGAVRGTLFPGAGPSAARTGEQWRAKRYAAARPAGAGLRRGGACEYLDTHPGDARAAELFRSYSGLYAQAAAAWEAENGPIVQRSAVGESGYDWLRGPWPWQYAANDGEG